MLRSNKLRSRKDFKHIFQRGARVNGRYFTLHYLANNQKNNRWAVVVSTKVSKRAVRRNRLRRRLSSLLKASQNSIKPGYDLVVVVKNDFFAENVDALNIEYAQVISKSGLLLSAQSDNS